MNSKKDLIARLLVPLTAMAVGSACFLERIGGPAPTSQVVYVTATVNGGRSGESTPSPTIESILDLTATWTPTPEPTHTATVAPVTMTAGQALSCVTGPHWILYEWVAGIAEGETVTLLARSTADWPDYFYVRTSGGKECWAFGGSSTISGNALSLPEREPPPLPEFTFSVTNNTYQDIYFIYIRGKDETAWGRDVMPGAVPLKHGQTFRLTLTAGFYDVQLRDHSNTTVLFEKIDAPMGPEPSSSVIVYDSRYTVVVRSAYAHDICRASIEDPPTGDTMDLTIPGDGIISPGEEVTLEALAGHYNFIPYRCGNVRLPGFPIHFISGGGEVYTIH